MNKVFDLTSRQKKIAFEIHSPKVLNLEFYKEELERFKQDYINADHNAFKKMLKKCRTSNEIFEIYQIMVGQDVIPMVYSLAECIKCLGIETVTYVEDVPLVIILDDKPITPEDIEKCKSTGKAYAKVYEEQIFNFKNAFLFHNPVQIVRDLKRTKNEKEILEIVSDLIISGMIPIFWPLISNFEHVDFYIVE